MALTPLSVSAAGRLEGPTVLLLSAKLICHSRDSQQSQLGSTAITKEKLTILVIYQIASSVNYPFRNKETSKLWSSLLRSTLLRNPSIVVS